ncbi:uncharacterized protein LOC121640513 isoform X2 [Melanotaenia boesemani]|uniref:uncharacterized protein LOC121640513 isoform X2 n=1 Tax=Melanotaenia boesemani TaxID=1250792 RepID=UPI001C040778|nr:uncharacterized protein LOC121640513 isoform X2 [Melanotaenia boesemani]
MCGILKFILMSVAFAGAAPVTSGPNYAAQDGPDENVTLQCSSGNTTLTAGHQDITVHVGEQCKLIFPKMSGDHSSVFLKRNGSNQYVGGCRDQHDLGESLDPLFTGQVEQSDCMKMDEGFSLTFMSLAMNYTGTYTWKSGGKSSSFTLNVTDGGGGIIVVVFIVIVVVIVVVIIIIFCVFVVFIVFVKNKKALEIKLVVFKKYVRDKSCFKNDVI